MKPVAIEDSSSKTSASKVFLLATAVFFLWAFLAPINSGVNLAGTVVIQGNRKAVQHPQGGVVQEILVQEGSVVQQGDVLLRINPLSVEAALTSTEVDHINALAVASRLLAERNESKVIEWMPELEAYANDERLIEAKRFQTKLFDSRREEFEGQRRILQEQTSGLELQVTEQKKVLEARQNQLRVVTEELKNNEQLAAEGFVPKSRANELYRTRSELLATIATTTSDLNRTKTTIAENKLKLTQLGALMRKDVDNQLSEMQKTQKGLGARVESLRFDQSLAALKAPVGGTVVGLKANTVGGVIQAGLVLMEIVPKEQRLIIEAQVPPMFIDKVRVGLEADMRFSAFNATTTPIVQGTVKLVGADKMPATNPQQGDYYLAQIETTTEGIQKLEGLTIQAGMPVEVIVKTGERTFISYLLKPIADRFARSFKE